MGKNIIRIKSDTNLLDKGKRCEKVSNNTNFAELCIDNKHKQKCIKLGKLRDSCIANAFTSNDCNLANILNNNTYIISAGSTNWNSDRDFSMITCKEAIEILLKCIEKIFYTPKLEYIPFEKMFDNNYYIDPLLYPINMKNSLKKLGFNNIYNIKGNSNYLFSFLPYDNEYYKSELLALENKKKGINPRKKNEYDNIKKQGYHANQMFLNIEYAINALKNGNENGRKKYLSTAYKEYLNSCSYKSESYYTQSSIMVVVWSIQLKIKLHIPLKCYIISAYENLLDFINHMGINYEKKISLAYVELLKFSKYIYRIFDSLNKSIGHWFPDIGTIINLVINSSLEVIKHRGEDIDKTIKYKIDICILYINNFNEFINKIYAIKKDLSANINIKNIENINIKIIFNNLLDGISYIANKLVIYEPSKITPSNRPLPLWTRLTDKNNIKQKRTKKTLLKIIKSKKHRWAGKIITSIKRTIKKRLSKKRLSKKKRSKKRRSKKKTKHLR